MANAFGCGRAITIRKPSSVMIRSEMAARWAKAGASRLHLVDLDAAKVGKPVNHEVIQKMVRAAGIPCQDGRGESAIPRVFDRCWMMWGLIESSSELQP